MSKPENQRSIFDIIIETVTGKRKDYSWTLRVDGASRGNPGQAGAGIYITKEDKDFFKEGYFLGHKTNNEAEYLALLVGLLILKKEADLDQGITIISDSQLLIRQMEGVYKVKKPELQQLHRAILNELGSVPCKFKHVEREYNTVADVMANKGVDTKKQLPLKVLNKLASYEIYF